MQEHILYFATWETGTLLAFFNVVLIYTLDQTVGALLMRRASKTTNFIGQNNFIFSVDAECR